MKQLVLKTGQVCNQVNNPVNYYGSPSPDVYTVQLETGEIGEVTALEIDWGKTNGEVA